MSLLLTGFTAFGRFVENPSAWLAEHSGRPFRKIDVSYRAADAFIASLDPASFDMLLMLGVAGTSSTFRFERVARNRHGVTPDVLGFVPEAGAIDDAVPGDLMSTLWTGPMPLGLDAVFSDDAGDYLCNYLYFRALQRFPTRRVGFLHVPPVEAMPSDLQLAALTRVINEIEAFTSS